MWNIWIRLFPKFGSDYKTNVAKKKKKKKGGGKCISVEKDLKKVVHYTPEEISSSVP